MSQFTIKLFSVLCCLSLANVIANPLADADAPMHTCDYHCTRSDAPICATNGQCMLGFQSECAMSAYNCQYPRKPFVVVNLEKCQTAWAPLCTVKDMRMM